MFCVTQAAAHALQQLKKEKGKEDCAIRLRIAQYGHTGGFVYDLDFCHTPAPDDQSIDFYGVRFFLEGKNLKQFQHITLDYDKQNNGFVFLSEHDKPNVTFTF